MLPTIRIKAAVSDDNPLGFIVINESDFDPAVHEALDPVEAIDVEVSDTEAAPARRSRKPKAE
jgi:hypothetical protein